MDVREVGTDHEIAAVRLEPSRLRARLGRIDECSTADYISRLVILLSKIKSPGVVVKRRVAFHEKATRASEDPGTAADGKPRKSPLKYGECTSVVTELLLHVGRATLLVHSRRYE